MFLFESESWKKLYDEFDQMILYYTIIVYANWTLS